MTQLAKRTEVVMKIGILQTGWINPALQDEFGTYSQMFVSLFHRQNAGFSFTPYIVYDSQFPDDASDCDGYIITGSAAGVYEDHDWLEPLFEFIRICHARRLPMIGICFGHQAIATALGGEVVKHHDGWGVGNRAQNATAPQALSTVTGCEADDADIDMIYFHQDQVIQAPDGAVVTLSDEFCPIGGYVLDSHVLSFQGHPEFSAEYTRALLGIKRDAIGDARTDEALNSLERDNHSQKLARWMTSFFTTAHQQRCSRTSG